MPDPSGKTVVKEIGGFRLIRQLGEGGMGKVFLAQQESLSRRVALKVLPPEMASDQEFVARFHREAQSAALFQHENVVNVFSAGRDAACGVHFIAFELVEGGSLEDLLTEQPLLPEERALFITRGIAQALTYAESKAIVHRDVKPDNILLDPEGNPKLADLGLAKQPSLETAQVTQTGMVLGTPLYMAPEQALGVDDLDIRADIYALGLCLWRMLTGLMPFDENKTNSSLQILTKHINEELPDVRERVSTISEGTAQIVAWMSARERSERYQSAKGLARDLDLVLTGEPPLGPELPADDLGATVSMPSAALRATSSRRTRPGPASGRQPSQRALPIPLIAGVLVGALGIGIGLAVALSRHQASPATVAQAPSTTPAAPTASVDPAPATPAPTPTPATAPSPSDPRPVESAADPSPAPPSPPPPTDPPPRDVQPDPPPSPSEDPWSLFAKRLDAFRSGFFVDPVGATPLGEPLLKSAVCLDDAQKKRFLHSMGVAKAILAERPSRDELGASLTRHRTLDAQAPFPGAAGAAFSGWLLELQRLNTLAAALETHLASASASRDATLVETLRKNLDPEAHEVFRATHRQAKAQEPQTPREHRSRKPPLRIPVSLETPTERLRAHALFTRYLVQIVNALDHWDDLFGFEQFGHSLAEGLVLRNAAVRKTAIGLALRHPLHEIQLVFQQRNAGVARAMATTWLSRGRERSPYIAARVQPYKAGRLPRGAFVVGSKRLKRVVFSLGSQTITVEPGSARVKGKPQTSFTKAWGETPILWLETRTDDDLVSLKLLNGIGQPLELFLSSSLTANDKFKIKAKPKAQRFVVPRIGPAPGGPLKLQEMRRRRKNRGGRRGRRGRRGF